MKLVRILDSFFLSDNPNAISLSDKIWFYGFYIFMFILLVIVALPTFFR